VGGGTGLVDAQVSWDYNGNFTTRQDLKQGLTETFVYDALNRLDYSQRNGVTNLDVTLDAIGNITWKSDVGSYSYHATKRRAVVSAGSHSYGYDANGNMTTRDGSTIAYATYNLPTSITAGANSSTLTYGAWRKRPKQVSVSADLLHLRPQELVHAMNERTLSRPGLPAGSVLPGSRNCHVDHRRSCRWSARVRVPWPLIHGRAPGYPRDASVRACPPRGRTVSCPRPGSAGCESPRD
jgi:hypothetical protein